MFNVVPLIECIRFARICSRVNDFNARNKCFKTAKLRRVSVSFKFYRRHHEKVSKFNVGLKSFLQQGLSEPEFYGSIVYKFKKIMGRTDFS